MKLKTCSSDTCTGLSYEWLGVTTETDFPVDAGVVVTVGCSDTDYINRGSSKVTCILETGFTFSDKPTCVKQGIIRKL